MKKVKPPFGGFTFIRGPERTIFELFYARSQTFSRSGLLNYRKGRPLPTL
jgi:hypothetical protein